MAEIEVSESELRSSGDDKTGEDSPGARGEQGERDGDQELGLEYEESESDAGEPLVVRSEGEIGGGDEEEWQGGELSANEEVQHRRVGEGAECDERQMRVDIGALPDQVDAREIEKETEGDPH